MKRLSTIDPLLTMRILAASPEKRCRAVYSACVFALKTADLSHPVIEEAMASIREGRPFVDRKPAELQSLAEDLDRKYLELDASSPKSPEVDRVVMKAFCRARAAAAVLYGTQWSVADEAVESVYETSITADEPLKISGIIENALSETPNA